MKRIEVRMTNDYCINTFIEALLNGAVEMLLMFAKLIGVACILTGAQSLRGVAWRVAAFLVASVALLAFMSHVSALIA